VQLIASSSARAEVSDAMVNSKIAERARGRAATSHRRISPGFGIVRLVVLSPGTEIISIFRSRRCFLLYAPVADIPLT
jgi:hypothetical protein